MTTPFSRPSLYISITHIITQRQTIVKAVLTPNFNSLCLTPKNNSYYMHHMPNINRHYILTTHCVYGPPLTLTINNVYISLNSINWLVYVSHMDCAP